jgi:2-keto-4-pentenoate hydratase
MFRREPPVLQPNAAADETARQFVAARKAAQNLPDYPGNVPQDLATAWAIQDSAIGQFDGNIAGWKVGRIHPPLSDSLGVDRLPGPVFADAVTVITNGIAPVGHIFNGGFGAVEAEFMFRIGQSPEPGKSHFTLEEAAGLIDTAFVGFEIASSPFPGINSMGPLVTISDFGNNNGLLVGPEIFNWRNSGLENWTVETYADGHLLATGKAASFPDGPIGSVRFLLENLAGRGIDIAPGMLVSSGAVTGVHEVTAGQKIEAVFGSALRIACTIEHAKAK